MKTEVYIRLSDGQSVSKAEAMFGGALRDGYSLRRSVMMRDADTISPHVSSGVGYSPATAARQRLADQERYRTIGAAHMPTQRVRPVGDGKAITSASQAAYERRVSDAWKETDPLPEPRRPHADGVKPKPATPVDDEQPATSASQAQYDARIREAWRQAS